MGRVSVNCPEDLHDFLRILKVKYGGKTQIKDLVLEALIEYRERRKAV